MTIYKCFKCKKVFSSYIHIVNIDNIVCKDCIKEIKRNKILKEEICPVCNKSKIDKRTLPATECNCILEKELENE